MNTILINLDGNGKTIFVPNRNGQMTTVETNGGQIAVVTVPRIQEDSIDAIHYQDEGNIENVVSVLENHSKIKNVKND